MSEPSLIAPWIAAGAATVATIVTLIFGFLSNTKLQHLKSQLDLQVHVHRVKFEKEFRVLQVLWTCLIELRNAAERFKPGGRSGKEVGEEAENEAKRTFLIAYGKFLRVIDTRKPFYPQEVFDLLEDYRRRQLKYFLQHNFITRSGFREDMVSPDFWAKRDENLKDIEKLVEDVCDAIRKRSEGRAA